MSRLSIIVSRCRREYRALIHYEKYNDILSRCYREYDALEKEEKKYINNSSSIHKLQNFNGVSSIYIPKDIILSLDWKTGDKIKFSVGNDTIYMKKFNNIRFERNFIAKKKKEISKPKSKPTKIIKIYVNNVIKFDESEVIRLYEEELLSVKEIATKLGTTYMKIHYIFTKNNIPRRSHTEATKIIHMRGKIPKPTQIIKDKISKSQKEYYKNKKQQI